MAEKYRFYFRLAGVIVIFWTIVAVGLIWMTAVPGQSFKGKLPSLSDKQAESASTMRQHVLMIGSKPRSISHSVSLESAVNYIEGEMASYGYKTSEQNFFVGYNKVRNVSAVIEPKNSDAATLVLGAHYDSIDGSPGANDNGSGVAALLELAKALKDIDGESGLKIRIVFFVNEEPPYFKTEFMGSHVYAQSLSRTDEKFLGMLSLETMGYYSDESGSQKYPWPLSYLYPDTGDFIAFVGDYSSRAFVRKTVRDFRSSTKFPSEGGAAPSFIPGIDWSDHRSFSSVGIPALMVTDTAYFRYPFYHTSKDLPDQLDYDRLSRVVSGLEKVVRLWSAI